MTVLLGRDSGAQDVDRGDQQPFRFFEGGGGGNGQPVLRRGEAVCPFSRRDGVVDGDRLGERQRGECGAVFTPRRGQVTRREQQPDVLLLECVGDTAVRTHELGVDDPFTDAALPAMLHCRIDPLGGDRQPAAEDDSQKRLHSRRESATRRDRTAASGADHA